MSKSIKTPVKNDKKDLRSKAATTLKKAFADLKKEVGEKEFEKMIKKASKLLSGKTKKNEAGKKVEKKIKKAAKILTGNVEKKVKDVKKKITVADKKVKAKAKA